MAIRLNEQVTTANLRRVAGQMKKRSSDARKSNNNNNKKRKKKRRRRRTKKKNNKKSSNSIGRVALVLKVISVESVVSIC